MKRSLTAIRAQADFAMGLGDTPANGLHRYGALAAGAALAVCAASAALHGQGQGPVVAPLVPIAATVWSLADLLTAFLLLAQFCVNGRVSFGILAVAYGLSGILTLPYLLAFPGIFTPRPFTVGEQQTSIFLWAAWHCSFPALVVVAMLNDSLVKRFVSRRAILLTAGAILILPLLAAGAYAAFVFGIRDELPHLVIAGRFQPAYRLVALPLIISLNALACAILMARRTRLTTLQLWLCVAMFAACLDGALNLSASRYSYAWDVGKLITVFAASIVLVMILCEIVGLYGRLAQVARIDPLTLLPNRRAFEEHLELVFHNGRRLRTGMAMLMIDIDLFKIYNDTYGHAAGDECLRAVARELAKCATRPLDLVARFGGEEFVVILPDTPFAGILVVAEQIRRTVEALEINLGSSQRGRVTVSVGVGYAANTADVTETMLFEAADRGLYQAKDSGRNRVVRGDTVIDYADSLGDRPIPAEPSVRPVTAEMGAVT